MSAKEILDLRWRISDDYIKNQIAYKPNADKLLHILKDKGYILALATIKDASIIAYEELIAKRGYYYNLYTSKKRIVNL